MSMILQKTKLFPPVNRYRLVDRLRLMERLDDILLPDCKLAIISGPAGSGKTTLINQWLASKQDLPAAWVSLDERDNQPALIFRYLVTGLQSILPGIGSEALALLQLPGVDLEEFVISLTNDLAGTSIQFVLVLDDFHTITNPAILRAMDLLLEAQPAWMHMILLTREDPVLAVARRRARGQLVELRQHDLKFSLPEAVAFLNQCMDLQLSNQQVELLETNTEGWIAGLQLAALSLQQSKDFDQFISGFSGNNRFILEYLVDEVFLNQPEKIQKFLLETSILERLCAGLCAAVTDMQISEAQSILDYLVRANLFIYSLDEEQQWYRYHHLFNDLLMARMCRTGKNQSNQLYSRASNWYEKNGDARLAVEYALKSQDISRAADLIEIHISRYWQTADLEFMFLINRLPEDEIIRRPSLCLHKAWVNVITGKMDQILPLVDAAENQLAGLNWKSRTDDEILRAFARILRTYIADFQNQSVELDKSLAEAYGSIPESNSGMRNSVAIILGTIHYMENDFSTALCYYEDALERDKRLKGTNAIPISVLRIVWVLQKLGQLRQVMALITKYERYVQQQGRRRFYIAGVLNLLMGEILYEWNRLDEAETQIREGLHLIKDWPSPSIIMVGYCLLTNLQIAQNNLSEARKTFLQVEELQHNNLFHPEFRNILEQTQLRLWIVEKNWLEIEGFTHKKIPLVPFFSIFRYEAALIGLCRAWIALGHHQKAFDLLTHLSASTADRKGSRIIILVLLAIDCKEQDLLAEQYLEEALRLAEPEGYIRTFLEMGDPLWKILKSWLHHHRENGDEDLKTYAYQIILAFEANEGRSSQMKKEVELPEPLSPRELEVLQLVSEGLTNKQIATSLIISIRTVKKHIENIHGKFGVQNRTQATTRARSLGLLNIE